MAIAFDAQAMGTTASGVTTLTFSHTCTGSDRLLALFVLYQGVDRTIDSVTYAGSPMTAIFGNTTYLAARSLALFYILAPSTGANNIVITMSGSTAQRLVGVSASYTGVKQSGVPDASASVLENNSVTSKTITMTTVADNCWMFGGIDSGGTLTAGANTTMRIQATGQVDDSVWNYDTNAAQTPAGSKSMTVNISPANTQHGMMAFSFAPATAAAAESHLPYLNLLGVGQ